MKTFLVLGAGTAGTMIARKMAKALDSSQWKVVLVDKNTEHYYQPGFLFVPFGMYGRDDVVKPIKNFVARNVEYVVSGIEQLAPAENKVTLVNGRVINYDYLVIATGAEIHPEETEGLAGAGWRQNIFDFYTYEGAAALHKALEKFEGGRLVVNVVEMPIKCPVAPLEFLFLADWYFTRKGIRNKVDLIYATPLPGAFTKPRSAEILGGMLKRKNIAVEAEFAAGFVDADRNVLSSYDEREIPYDLLVSVPLNKGADFVGAAGIGDELNFVKTDKYTLQSSDYPNIFVMGDATNIPASKAGAVIHFQIHTAFKNIVDQINGKPLNHRFDGHALCYIETGFKKATLIDFDYEHEPLPGKYPVAGIGPFDLLGETTLNHWGKLAFKFMYWNLMLKGIEVPLPNEFSMAGKKA
jgi:sulfide:quinone oxidoreductase